MFKLIWIFGLVILFFVFLFVNSNLDKNIETITKIENKTKKDKFKLFLCRFFDKLLRIILLLYFLIVLLTIVGMVMLFTIMIFN